MVQIFFLPKKAYLAMEDVKVDIVDKLGERKFMNTKQDQSANTF